MAPVSLFSPSAERWRPAQLRLRTRAGVMLVSDELRLALSGSHPPPRCRPAELGPWDPSLCPRALPAQFTLVLLGPCREGSPGAACALCVSPPISHCLCSLHLSLSFCLSLPLTLYVPHLCLSLSRCGTRCPRPLPPTGSTCTDLVWFAARQTSALFSSLEKANQLCCRTRSPSSKNSFKTPSGPKNISVNAVRVSLRPCCPRHGLHGQSSPAAPTACRPAQSCGAGPERLTARGAPRRSPDPPPDGPGDTHAPVPTLPPARMGVGFLSPSRRQRVTLSC